MDKKKQDELNIVRKIYHSLNYEVVKASENPDFILKDNGNNDIFGVEVTRYYDTPTSGRHKNIPNYSENIINKVFIHKGDIGKLKIIEDITRINDDGTETPLLDKAVMRQLPQSPDRIKTLKMLVTEKNSKFTKYDHSLKYIDLIIHDDGDLIAGIDIQKTQILNYLRQQEQVNTIVSPFRKIVLVIQVSTKEHITIILKTS